MQILCYDSYGNSINHLTQWDMNQKIYIKDWAFDKTPDFHFCNKKSIEPILVKSTLLNGELVADIPNSLLAEPYPLTIYIYLCADNSAKTIFTIEIPVRKRIKPDGYEYADNVEIIELSKLDAELKETIDDIKTFIGDIQTRLENGEFKGEKGDSVTIDTELSEDSENPVANRIITEYLLHNSPTKTLIDDDIDLLDIEDGVYEATDTINLYVGGNLKSTLKKGNFFSLNSNSVNIFESNGIYYISDITDYEISWNDCYCITYEELSEEIETLQNKIDQGISNVGEKANEALTIAKGKNRALVFTTYQELSNWLDGTYTRRDGKTKDDLQIGDNLYIIEVEVPDYWWDGTDIKVLETQKVGLGDYIDKSTFDEALLTKATMQSLDASSGLYIGDISPGIYQITKGGRIKKDRSTSAEYVELNIGDILIESQNKQYALVIATKEAIIYSLWNSQQSWVDSYLFTREEVENTIVSAKQEIYENVKSWNQYKLICDITTTESKTYIPITQNVNNNAFSLKRVRIYIEAPVASANDGILIKMTDTYSPATVNGGALINVSNALNTEKARFCTIDIEVNEFGAFSRGTAGAAEHNQGTASGGHNPNVTSINKLLIRTNTADNTIPTGTKIKIWGY